jgi:hypothetical protein
MILPQASRELLKDGTFFRRKKELREEQLNEIEVSCWAAITVASGELD